MSGNSKISFRPDLQGLRALAVTVVVLSHAGVVGFTGGFVGVDLFFVLSGYLITGALFNELANTRTVNLLHFYDRRLKRLLPALLLVVVVTLALAFLLLGSEAKHQIASAPYVMLWLSNFHFAFRDSGYFDELASNDNDLFLHTWSLGVEEQFYLIWPLLLVALSWRIARDSRAAPRAWKRAVIGFAVIGIVSFLLNLFWSNSQPILAFYQMPTRAWQFALGALVFLILRPTDSSQLRDESLIIGGLLLAFGIAAIAVSVVYYHPNLIYPGWAALTPSLGAACVISAGYFLPHQRNALTWVPFMWLGDRSYSIYLWHWPLLLLTQALVGPLTAPSILLALMLTIVSAALTYRFVELPFWKGALSRAEPRTVLQVGLLAMLLGVLVSFHSARQPVENIGLVAEDISRQWRMDLPAIYKMRCDDWYANDEVRPCVFGQEDARNTVMLLGDSIGAQWFSLVALAFEADDWRVVVLTKSSCPMVDESIFYARIKQVYTICESWRDNVLSRLNEWRPNLVIVGSASTYDFSEDEWVSGSQRVWSRLSESGARVVVLPGTPALGMDGPSCVMRQLELENRDIAGACQSDQSESVQFEVAGLLRRAAKGLPEVDVLDLNDRVCPSGICRAQLNQGVVVYRDSQHLTDSFVRTLLPEIGPVLKSFTE